eukprot:CAMPEP_0169109450 /NCGR_PEP_ID=MMETSP1015-20121227/25972_1 /TAXON_ID=342587 /ORGANISM="Karlodinium micrum, Strain CCMP2283" /LENGTH=139 /DNA_ID=CAMNT_0009171149 /DNA_START=191 /DNA_END=607 /DNA_ORIENTATION=+
MSCQVEHVNLVVIWFWESIKMLLREDDMTRAASAFSATGALDVYVVLMSDLQYSLSALRRNCKPLTTMTDESDVKSAKLPSVQGLENGENCGARAIIGKLLAFVNVPSGRLPTARAISIGTAIAMPKCRLDVRPPLEAT